MKLINYFLGSISALAGILLMICMIIDLTVVQSSFLNYTNEKYNVAEKLSVTDEELEKVVGAMISYVKGESEDAQIIVEVGGTKTEFFNQKELKHLLDVKNLMIIFQKIKIVLTIPFGVGTLFMLKKRKIKELATGIILTWFVLIVMSLVMGIMAIIDINNLVNGFHKLFFADDTWILNPAFDRSVWMFRSDMYKDVLLQIGKIIFGIFIFTNGIAFIIILLAKKSSSC